MGRASLSAECTVERRCDAWWRMEPDNGAAVDHRCSGRLLHLRPIVFPSQEYDLLVMAEGLYIGLSGVQARIWELCDGHSALGAVADRITQEYEVDRDTALADVLACVPELMELGLLSAVRRDDLRP